MSISTSEVFDESCGLSYEQLDKLFTAPKSNDLKSCWVLAVMVFVKTGNLYEAVIAFLECLVSSVNLSRADTQKVEGTIKLIQVLEGQNNDKVLQCVFDLVIDLIAGKTIDKVIWNFIMCLFSGGGDPPEPPEPGDISPPEYNECDRCG
jgi:hypothetical protein